jgi:hypothetical protein
MSTGTPAQPKMRHFARQAGVDGTIEIVDRNLGFVRATLTYDYRVTCYADQWNHAQRICAALDSPMSSQGSQGVVTAAGTPALSNDRHIELAWKRAETSEIEALANKLVQEQEAGAELDLSRVLYLAFRCGFIMGRPGTPALSAPPRSREAAALDIAVAALLMIRECRHTARRVETLVDRTLANIAALREGAPAGEQKP